VAKPQLEDGYTRVANEVLEKVYSLNLNGTQLRLLLCVWRYTYGFQRKECEGAISFLAKAIGADKKNIKKNLDTLIIRKILLVTKEATFSKPRVISFNKNYDEWVSKDIEGVKRPTVYQNTITTVGQTTYTTGGQLTHQERKEKEILKDKDIVEQSTTEYPYKEVIDYLNAKSGKGFKDKSKDTRKHIAARFNEGYSLDDFRKVIDNKVQEWNVDPERGERDMRQYIRPSTLFGPKFESYLNQQPVAKSQSKNKFHNFDERTYDMDELERQLMNN